ncbi:hypothetical protein GCM10010967_20810 [Dyadobacter beijingensis]|uniref:Uncharacterized protein n=1 Tax=Dyadobacter beijingensis TaxID=365489 RepID=A0ABQ2HPQ3_9BACT|nr:hypothetical protein [Dyadobacter beijingensis]GGM88031.1 hypothetical protein GCM10010967_20810 [Dyadobacter beijingensis]
MKLTLSSIVESPVILPYCSTWVAEKRRSFIISNYKMVAELGINGTMDVIRQSSGDSDGILDDALPAGIYEDIRKKGINGFQLLPKSDYKNWEQFNGGALLIEAAKSYGLFDNNFPVQAHDGLIISFGKKSIIMSVWENGQLATTDIAKTKGKAPISTTLHPQENLVIYGTNYGELYAQDFSDGGFEKAVKIDQLPNTCYQMSFDPDGRNLFVCGMGYLRIFEFKNNAFTQRASLMTASRSFALAGNFLVLNKGIHGIDVLNVAVDPARVTSLDVPFTIDKMEYLSSAAMLLVTSGSSQDLGLIRCEMH